MYVEVCLASICTFIWWFSQPGLVNQLALSTIFVCSVSTVMFNANPLLRYDGYYILSDLVEIPNLRQKASSILNHKLGAWCLGLEEPDDPFLPQRNQVFFVEALTDRPCCFEKLLRLARGSFLKELQPLWYQKVTVLRALGTHVIKDAA